MAYESTSVVSGSCQSLRSYLTAGGAVASAGILAFSLVAAPPDFNDARTEVRTVQLAAFKLPPALPPGALLKQLVSNQADTVGAVALLVPGGAADITTAVVKTPFTFVRILQPTGSATEAVRTTAESTIDPAIPSQQDNALLADEIFTNLVKVLLIPFVLAFVGVAWVISQIQIFFYNRENAAVAEDVPSSVELRWRSGEH